MKIDFEKIVFYFTLIAVSGSIGYALKPEPIVKEKSNASQIRECVQAIHIMEDYRKKNYYQPKTQKELAIERMMSK